jgi:hypothetical protein
LLLICLKTLFPSSFERQNVNLVLNVFNEKNISALSRFPTNTGTVNFMKIINKWWNIVNVKSLFKGQAKRLEEAFPIRSVDDQNLLYLETFCNWVNNWDKIVSTDTGSKSCKRPGKLSDETSFAPTHH